MGFIEAIMVIPWSRDRKLSDQGFMLEKDLSNDFLG